MNKAAMNLLRGVRLARLDEQIDAANRRYARRYAHNTHLLAEANTLINRLVAARSIELAHLLTD
jgi:hypothetical protein